jgi:hypothetical protein
MPECLKEIGSVLWHNGPPCCMASQDIACTCKIFQKSHYKSVPHVSLELSLLHSAVHDALHKKLKLHAYKLQLVQKIACTNQDSRKVCFRNAFTHTLKKTRPSPTESVFLIKQCFMCLWKSQQAQMPSMVEWKSSLLNISAIHQRSASN